MPVSRWFSFLAYRFLLTKGTEKYEVINVKDPSQVCYYQINEKGVEFVSYKHLFQKSLFVIWIRFINGSAKELSRDLLWSLSFFQIVEGAWDFSLSMSSFQITGTALQSFNSRGMVFQLNRTNVGNPKTESIDLIKNCLVTLSTTYPMNEGVPEG